MILKRKRTTINGVRYFVSFSIFIEEVKDLNSHYFVADVPRVTCFCCFCCFFVSPPLPLSTDCFNIYIW